MPQSGRGMARFRWCPKTFYSRQMQSSVRMDIGVIATVVVYADLSWGTGGSRSLENDSKPVQAAAGNTPIDWLPILVMDP
jgi:hypothetical protein